MKSDGAHGHGATVCRVPSGIVYIIFQCILGLHRHIRQSFRLQGAHGLFGRKIDKCENSHVRTGWWLNHSSSFPVYP